MLYIDVSNVSAHIVRREAKCGRWHALS